MFIVSKINIGIDSFLINILGNFGVECFFDEFAVEQNCQYQLYKWAVCIYTLCYTRVES